MVCGVFLFFVGGFCWFWCERYYNANFDSVPQALFFGGIFTLSEWADVDFTFWGALLCVCYCLFGVAFIGLATGALYDGLGDALANYAEARKKIDWSKTKEWYDVLPFFATSLPIRVILRYDPARPLALVV